MIYVEGGRKKEGEGVKAISDWLEGRAKHFYKEF